MQSFRTTKFKSMNSKALKGLDQTIFITMTLFDINRSSSSTAPPGWRYALWGARCVGKSICSSAIMNHRLPLPMKISEKTPLQPSFLLSPVYWQLLCSRGCISGQMGPDDQHYHNLAHPKHTPILTIKWPNGNLPGHWTDNNKVSNLKVLKQCGWPKWAS